MVDVEQLNLDEHGAARYPRAALSLVSALLELADAHYPEGPGHRLFGDPELAALLGPDRPIGALAAVLLGTGAKPVRAILFDKTPEANWALGWHQDRTIAVRERIDLPGFGPWTIKRGIQHVEPPFEILARLVTLRVHLDAVDNDNAPLLIVPGSHLLARIAEPSVANVVAKLGTVACHAEVGDVWAYRTPILHASARSVATRRRRVLQIDFAGVPLPGGLQWLGV